MDILTWGITIEWMNENKSLHLTLLFSLWLTIGVVAGAIVDRLGGSANGEVAFYWLMWTLFGWAVVSAIIAAPLLSIVITLAIYILYVACSKLHALIVNCGKEQK